MATLENYLVTLFLLIALENDKKTTKIVCLFIPKFQYTFIEITNQKQSCIYDKKLR